MRIISFLIVVLLVSCQSVDSNLDSLNEKSHWQLPKNIKVEFSNGMIILYPSRYKKSKRKALQYQLISKKRYKNFIFEAEVFVKPPKTNTILPQKAYGNSGVFIRGQKMSNYRLFAYQFEVDPSPRGFSGGLYIQDNKRKWTVPKYTYKSKDKKYYKPLEKEAVAYQKKFAFLYKKGRWNKIKIICQDNRLQFFLNGVKTVDYIDKQRQYSDGFIGLQHHGENNRIYKFRNVGIAKL